MPLLNMVAEIEGGSSILDSGTLTFIINGMKEVLGIMTTPPLGIYLTIGVVGSIVALAVGLAYKMKKH